MNKYIVSFSDRNDSIIEAVKFLITRNGDLAFCKYFSSNVAEPFKAYAYGTWIKVALMEQEEANNS